MVCVNISQDLFFNETQSKKSRFISYLFSCNICSKSIIKAYTKTLKEQHQKASHFVYAFRYFNENLQIEESFSDDGEPKNSSAKPILNVLRGLDLINTGIISVRYFGGIKLGIGGLVRAYTKSCKEVLALAQEKHLIYEYEKINHKIFYVNFSNLSIIDYQLIKYSLQISNKEFLAKEIKIGIKGVQKNIDLFLQNNSLLIKETL